MCKASRYLMFLLALPLLAPTAAAQLPTATGREIQLSNSAWKVFIPDSFQMRRGGRADVLVHFHGNPQTVWNNVHYANLNAIVVTVNYGGLSSAYSGPFSNSSLFQSLLEEARTEVLAEPDFFYLPYWEQIGISSFSAGYGAVREILKSASYRNAIDGILAADSLYATTAGDGTPLDSQMVNYKDYASQAQAGNKTFLFSHSQVLTYTYENTMETGDELMQHLGIAANADTSSGLGTLQFYRHAESGNFQLWGATGADGDAHLEHLRYMGHFLKELPLDKLPGSADFNSDGRVDSLDFLIYQRGGSPNPWSSEDLALWHSQYASASMSTATAVPEPSGAMLVAVALCCLVRRRHL